MSNDLLTRTELRLNALRERDMLTVEVRDAYSKLIEERALNYISELPSGSIHCYLSFRSEVQTQSLIEKLFGGEREVITPYVKDGLMHHSILRELTFTIGEYGIPEPANKEPADLATMQAVVVPLVAFDGYGHRLGYGKGYYDKFLSTISPNVKKIGLAFSIQEIEKIPNQAHDIRLDYIVTEQGMIQASDESV